MNNNFLNKIIILIVENSQIDRKILVDALLKYFPNILEASNGEEGYEIYKENKNIDIIISDLNVEKLSGINFLKLIRASNLNIPFIVTTARIEVDTMIEAINLNVSSYIPKPIDIGILLQKIDSLCEKKHFESRLEEKRKEIAYLLEAVDVAALIFRMNAKGEISYMNTAMCEVSGYDKEEITSLNFDDIIHPEIPKKYINRTWDELKNGKLWKGNTKFITKEGETFYLNNTIFKTNMEDFITIAFLTTKENLEKRDFQRKVILKFQESNKREFELKTQNSELEEKFEKLKNLYEGTLNALKVLKDKNISNVRQLNHYELQGDNLTQKYEKFMNSKKEEVEVYIKSLNIEKKKNEKLIFKYDELLELVNNLKEKNTNLEEEIKNKNIKINDLNEILLNKENEKSKKGLFDFNKK
ncbi:response regulator [Arcobacter sp.]|uniref:response regulator n=1 Tax=unclassified Arcobacter TaxID=2593671 RepID=UPI003AFF95BF